MSQLRDLLSDLVEKRLWPLALLLVGALVAVPLVLAKSAPPERGDASPPAAVAPAGAPAPGQPVVSVAKGAGASAPLRGHAKDPFHQQFVAKPAAPKSPGKGTPNPSTSGKQGTPNGSDGPGGSGHGEPQQTLYAIVHLKLRFGKATGRLRTYHDVARLTALPSASNPIAIFLGMRKDLKTTVFLLSTDVHARGDGKCAPSRKDCEAIELKEGQTELLDVAANDGKVTQYELDLVKVTITWTPSKTKAQAAYARASHAGARLLDELADEDSGDGDGETAVASGLRYSPEQGVLLPVPAAFPSAEGSAESATALPRALAGADRDGALVPLP